MTARGDLDELVRSVHLGRVSVPDAIDEIIANEGLRRAAVDAGMIERRYLVTRSESYQALAEWFRRDRNQQWD